MGRILRTDRHRAQALPKRKGQNEIKELREENRRLRELVAQLSKLAVERITDTVEPGEPSASDPRAGR
jgi:transposase-like protein